MKVLNVGQLEKYLFSAPKFPHYRGDLGQLLFGCETEYLIESISNSGEYLGKDICIAFFNYMVECHGYKTFSSDDLTRISKDTELGFICIKPDFGYPVLEISFPPRASIEKLRDLIQATLDEIDGGLTKLGFMRTSYSTVPNAPYKYDLLEFERHGTWLSLVPPRDSHSSEFYFPDYPAMMSSTQVHLNILDRNFFEHLPLMYELEWKAVSTFSKSRHFNGLKLGCARVLLLEETLGPKYLLKTIPEKIPTTVEEYCISMNALPKYFPKDPFFPAKDYSFIRPRTFGSVEFRSACAQVEVEEILNVCAFRVLQIAYAIFHRSDPIRHSDFTAREALLTTARSGLSRNSIHSAFQRSVQERLNLALNLMPSDWRKFIERSIIMEKAA